MRPSKEAHEASAAEQSNPQPRAAELGQRSTERKLRNLSPRREEKPPTPIKEKIVMPHIELSTLTPKLKVVSSTATSFQGGSLTFQRHKVEKVETQGCNCRRSFCLKLQCPCFSSGQLCKQGCNCDQCKNLKDNMERSEVINRIIVRNPHAFSRPTQISEGSDNGCHCHNSKCIMKYCKCFSKGKLCTDKCACQNCKNTSSRTAREARSSRKEDPELEKGKHPRKKPKLISQN